MNPCNVIRNLVVIVLAVGLSASCGKELPSQDSGRRAVRFLVTETATRASVTGFEDNVVSLDLLAFNSANGIIDRHFRVTGSHVQSISAELSANMTVNWYILANVPQSVSENVLSGYVNEAGFLAGTSLLSDSSLSTLVMFASGKDLLVNEASSVNVTLNHYSSKVSLGSVSFAWLDSFETKPSVTLEKVVLINVNGSCPYSGTPAVGDVWFNKMGISGSLSTVLSDMLVFDCGSRSVTDSNPFEVNCSLYCMPNPTNNSVNSSTNPEWSVRNTRLVLEFLVDGEPNWYPIDIPSMQCNTHYVANTVTLNGPGAPGPDMPIVRVPIDFSIEIMPWNDNQIPLTF